MYPAFSTPVTPQIAKTIENHCLKLRKEAIAAISPLSRTTFPTRQEEVEIAQRHRNVTIHFTKLLHCEGYPTRGAAFTDLADLYYDLEFFIEQFSPEGAGRPGMVGGEGQGLMVSCLTILLSDLYANTLVPQLECMVDYLRVAGQPEKRERGTFELLGDAMAWYYAERCFTKSQAGKKGRVTMWKERREAQGMGTGSGLKGMNTKKLVVATRADSVVDADSREMERPSMAEVVFGALRCPSPVDGESAHRTMDGCM
jgi:hypothetical protein